MNQETTKASLAETTLGSAVGFINTPAHFVPLRDLPFVVLVGLTGVGKTTTMLELKKLNVHFSLLPNRRDITNEMMIAPHIESTKKMSDLSREERFALTAQYRQKHPGGMAEAIGHLMLDTQVFQFPIFFDGLRGLDEVSYAATHYTKARFVLLDAPDTVRVQRLLGRNDAFDKISNTTNAAETPPDTQAQLQAIKNIEAVFEPNELRQLASLNIDQKELLGKVKIIVTERNNYDPVAARNHLQTIDAKRVLYLNTETQDATTVAFNIKDWL